MEYVMIGLLLFSIVLIVLSFFLKDPVKELKEEFDHFTMETIQDVYQLKRKMKILEEELLMDDSTFDFIPPKREKKENRKKEIHSIIKNQVWTLHQQGVPLEQIAKQSSLQVEDVQQIIVEFSKHGDFR